jgi:hypothetical protein
MHKHPLAVDEYTPRFINKGSALEKWAALYECPQLFLEHPRHLEMWVDTYKSMSSFE